MEKAIEIKRRAQRCIQNGDLDGALNEYEKLVQVQDSDPYNYVLLADLQFKRGDADQAVQRYLAAVGSYEKAGLYKNAIAVCKKMMRLSLAPAKVLERLAALHALDGLGTEASLYYMQYAETLVRDGKPKEAAEALQQAFDASPDEVKALERMSEAWMLADEPAQAARAMGAAAYAYERLGRLDQVERCRRRAEQLQAGTMGAMSSERGPLSGLIEDATPSHGHGAPSLPVPDAASAAEGAGRRFAGEAHEVAGDGRLEGLVTPMAPTSTGHHAPSNDLELERVPTGVLGATAHEAPPRLESDGPDAIDTADDEARDEPHGPPRLPAALRDLGSPAMSTFESEPAGGPDAATLDDGLDQPDESEAIAAAELDEPSEEAPVYDIDAEEEPATASIPEGPAPAFASEPPADEAIEIVEETIGPDALAAIAAEVAAPAPREAAQPKLTIADIESLLSGAQERFRAGDREGAAALLVDAALAYERADRLDNAASIFRSLARGPQTSNRLLELWLANCERRNDRREAGEVACELGDRALNDGDMGASRGWFERACDHDPENAVARRRLSRLAELANPAAAPPPVVAAPVEVPQPDPAPVAAAPVAPAAAQAPAPAERVSEAAGDGRVEMSVGRAEAVSFDLGALLSEFQRGIEAQLSGDAQSHYDLAMTYHEMGLHAQAVDGFRLAAADPAFAYRAAEMIGRCLLDQGRFEEAVHEFSEALRSPKIAPEAVLGLRYQLGLAYEAAGDLTGALAEFERVFEQQANYSDVALKIRSLRTSLGQA